MFAILLCVAVVIPQGILGNGPSGDKLVVQAGQRAALNWSIGLILIGITTAAPPSAESWIAPKRGQDIIMGGSDGARGAFFRALQI